MDVKDTIKSNNDIDRLFKTGRKITTNSIIALVAENIDGRDHCGRVAFVAGKKLGSAPIRNKAKRRMREVARLKGVPFQRKDLVLIARPSTTRINFNDLLKDMSLIVQRIITSERGTQ